MIGKILNSLKSRVASIVLKAIVTSIDDAGGLQVLQVDGLTGETLDGIPRLQEYGFSSTPENGSEVILLSIGGDRSDSVAIVVGDSKYRLKLSEGEVSIYNKFGDYVKLKKNKIEINSDSVVIGSPAAVEAIPLGDALKTYLDSFFDDVMGGWNIPVGTSAQNASAITEQRTLYTAWSTKHSLDNYLSQKNKVD